MANLDLKPCPFCGSEAVQAFNKGRYGMFGYVKCTMCDGQSKTTALIEPREFESEDEFWNQKAWTSAIIAWNTRVDKQSEGHG